MKKTKKINQKIINRKAKAKYTILDIVEAGIQLLGPEVKSLRQGRVALQDSFVTIRDGEAFVHNMNISGYKFADLTEYEPTRPRKLLLHKKQILQLEQKMQQKGMTLVVTAMYPRANNFKVEVGLARGKKVYERREELKKRDTKREVQAQLRGAKYKG